VKQKHYWSSALLRPTIAWHPRNTVFLGSMSDDEVKIGQLLDATTFFVLHFIHRLLNNDFLKS
jgi:hypothetical protein